MGRARSRTKSASSSHIVTSREDPSSCGWKVSIPSNWVPRWIWREHILCLVLFLLDLSNWEMYLFLFRAFFVALLKYPSCNWRLIWLLYLCLWTKYIPFIAVFQYTYKGFYIESEIRESPFVVQNKMTGQENWEFFANDNGQWVKLFLLGNKKKKKRSCLCGICNTVEREFPAPVSPQQPRC